MSRTNLKHAVPTPQLSEAESQLLDIVTLLRRHANRSGTRIDIESRRLLAEVASVIGEAHQSVAQQSARLRALEDLAITDELTGLLNRRGFDRELRRALARGRRHGERGLLIMGDLNRFKRVNDTFGHAAGDAVLKEVARLLQTLTRETDQVARLGGDEFAVILCDGDPDEARARWKKIERRINQQVLRWQGRNITLSASFGSAAYNGGSSAETLMRKADRALYRKKGPRLVYSAASDSAASDTAVKDEG